VTATTPGPKPSAKASKTPKAAPKLPAVPREAKLSAKREAEIRAMGARERNVALAALKATAAMQADDSQAWGDAYSASEYVFTDESGQPLHPAKVSYLFNRSVADAVLPRITLHGLRHTWATLAIAAGVPVLVVSQRLGHSSVAFTMQRYQHVLPGMQADAAALVASIVAAARAD
jgi:integrase